MQEFDPIFEAGFHDITMDQIEEIFVENFDNSDNRKYLMSRLKVLLNIISEINIKFEIWIDGSFATKKQNPNDIDIAIICDPIMLNSLPEDKKIVLLNLFNNRTNTKLRYSCDIYFFPQNDIKQRSYWRGWFGFSRDEKPKGIPRLFLYTNNN